VTPNNTKNVRIALHWGSLRSFHRFFSDEDEVVPIHAMKLCTGWPE